MPKFLNDDGVQHLISYIDEEYPSNDILIAALKAVDKTISEIPQSDWNQNDETAKDYIKNRPFYNFNKLVEHSIYNMDEGEPTEIFSLDYDEYRSEGKYVATLGEYSFESTSWQFSTGGASGHNIIYIDFSPINGPSSLHPLAKLRWTNFNEDLSLEFDGGGQESPFSGEQEFKMYKIYSEPLSDSFIPDTIARKTDFENYYSKEEANTLHSELEAYIDTEVAALVNSAPETLDTLGELATALEENKDVVDALDMAISTKANQSDLNTLNNTVVSHTTSINALKTETWTFTLSGGSTVSKQVVIK